MRLALIVLSIFVAASAYAGQIHLRYGYAISAEYWWEDGGMLWYVRNGERAAVPRSDVVRVEGSPQFPPGMSWNASRHDWQASPNPLIIPPSTSETPRAPAPSSGPGSQLAVTALHVPIVTSTRCPWR